MTTPQQPYIVFADDDEDDRDLIVECCNSLQVSSPIKFVETGEELLQYLDQLRHPSAYPSLIVLDINMPRMNGAETLVHLKQNERYKDIPVVIYSTTSRNPELYTEGLGASRFIRKPDNLNCFRSCVQQIITMIEPLQLRSA
jgi:CheY-like chemotaxis protein